MTFYKTVVSWLAFLFLVYRGVLLTLAWTYDAFGIKVIPEREYLIHLLGLGGVRIGEVAVWSPLWALVALALISPWIMMVTGRTFGWPEKTHYTGQFPVFLNMLGRWGFSVLVLGSLLEVFPRGIEGFCRYNPYAPEERFDGYFTGIFAVSILGIFSAMLIAPEFTRLASSGLTGFIDAVFFPGGREKKPPYTLKLARFYGDKERWEEAEAEYARMLSFYPDRLEAWQERLELAFRREKAADPDPEEVLASGLKRLGTVADRESLYQTFVRAGGSPDDRV